MDAETVNWRGRLQEYEQQAGRRPPLFRTSSTDNEWCVTVLFDRENTVETVTAPKSVFARKKYAERHAAQLVYGKRFGAQPQLHQERPAQVPMSPLQQDPIQQIESHHPPPPQYQKDQQKQQQQQQTCDRNAFNTWAFVDVDNAHWISKAIERFPSVYFYLYASCGTSPPGPPAHVRNYEWIRLQQPGKDLDDTLIIIHIAQCV